MDNKIRCSKCNSENVQMQAKEYKPKMIVPSCMVGAGIGLMITGLPGAIVGIGIGLLIGIVLNAIMSNTYQSVCVCQSCGYVSQPIVPANPLFCSAEESNLDVIRNDIDKGFTVVIRVRVDDYEPFYINDNTTKNLKVTKGVHTIAYEQIYGIGRKNNKGQLSVEVDDKKSVKISFTRKGLIVE